MSKTAPLRIQDATLRRRHTRTIDECREIWENQLLPHYTRHGVDHSDRIAERFAEFIAGGLLNDVEKYILLQAVYLHDVGMQDIVHSCPDKNRATLTAEDYERIRMNHHEASAEWITEDARGSSERNRHTLALKDDPFADLIALVSLHHTKSDLSALKEKDKEVVHRGGKAIRVLLLAALLIVGDELDLDTNRVNMALLEHQPIPTDSVEHWWKHYYVESCHIVDQRVELIMEVPVSYQAVYARALADSITRPLRKQLAKPLLRDALQQVNIDLKVDEPRIVYDDEGRKRPLPPEVFINPTAVLRYDDIAALKVYDDADVIANPSTHFYGFNPQEMTAPEIRELLGFDLGFRRLTSDLGGLKLKVLDRQLRGRVSSLLLASPLVPQARLFLYQKAGLILASQLEHRLLPEGQESAVPRDVTDEYMWEWFQKGDGRLLCPEPEEYERWRGAVQSSLGQQPDLVAQVEAMSKELGQRLAVMVLATNNMASWDDPGVMGAINWYMQLSPEIRAEMDELQVNAQQPQATATGVPSGTLMVTVMAGGRPMVGRKVYVSSVATRSTTLATDITDYNGHVTVVLPGNTSCQVGAEATSGVSADPLHCVLSRAVPVMVPAGATVQLNITFPLISGRIVDRQGQPLGSVRVKLNSSACLLNAGPYYGPYATQIWTLTDMASGTFSLIAAPGTWDLELLYGRNKVVREIEVTATDAFEIGDIEFAL